MNELWWAAQWPILIGGLLVAFAGILYLGPNVDHPRWQFLTPGSVVAVLIWLAHRACSRSTSATSARTTRPGGRSPRSW